MVKRHVILDSTPLALLVKRKGVGDGDRCRSWFTSHSPDRVRFYVPEIVLYQVRRELIRLGSTASLVSLETFIAARPGRLVVLDSPALRLAAELWASVRRRGAPTADRHALDIDVILAAQVLTADWNVDDVIVATSNTKHIRLFVPAADWAII